MNTAILIRDTERLETICIRLERTSDQERRRKELVFAFEKMATDLGKLAIPYSRPDWGKTHSAVSRLRWAAVQADESRIDTFTHVGAETALVTSLHSLAAALGFILEEAAGAIHDAKTMVAVEGRDVGVAAE